MISRNGVSVWTWVGGTIIGYYILKRLTRGRDIAKYKEYYERYFIVEDNTVLKTEESWHVCNGNRPTVTKVTGPKSSKEEDGEVLNTLGNLQYKRLGLLRARVYTLLAQFKFDKAAKPLEEIASMQIPIGLDTNLLFIDCFLHLGRENKANKAIEDTKKILLASPLPDVADVISLADEFTEVSSFIRAMVLYRIAGEMYERNSNSANATVTLDGIYNCISKSNNVVGGMIRAGDRLRVIGIDYGIEYMSEMLNMLRSVQNVNAEKKNILEAWCANWVGFNYGLSKDNLKSVTIRTAAAEAFERHFKPNETKYRVYGILLHNIGIGYYNMDKFLDAQSYFIKAIDAKKAALDYDTEDDRSTDVKLSEKDLADTLEKLVK